MATILVISREGGDFSMDLIFAGLVRRFGIDNVVDYPPRDKHRQGRPSELYNGDFEHDYGVARRSLCYVDGYEHAKRYTHQEAMNLRPDFVFMDETDESESIWRSLFQFWSWPTPTVIVAGHDSFRQPNMSILKERHSRMLVRVFADNWKKEWDELDYVSPTNISCNFDHLWDSSKREEFLNNKMYDICFIGYNSHPTRKIVIDHIKRRWNHLNNFIIFEERSDTFDAFIRHNDMFEIMAKSKICLNLKGAARSGWALRYYETPYVGSFMLSQDFPGREMHLDPFRDDVHCRYFYTLETLDLAIESMLENENRREELALAGHLHCISKHSVDARIDYIMGEIDESKSAV